MAKQLIFQLGTNNWQRPLKDGSGTLEFAPGSGVLHEAHHNAYNLIPGVKCYSMYPSQGQGQPTDPNADYAVFELPHPIPICESASPNSSKRWHGMDDAEFTGFKERLEKEVYDYMKKCEAREGTNFTMCIAHHSFLNPLVLRNVIQRRVKEGLPKCPLYCFVHGTALKMYRWELGPKETAEQKSFPLRFHPMIMKEKLFDDQENGITACFVISAEQKGGIKEIFPMFPQERVIVAPNGINVEKFKPREKTLLQVLVEQTRTILWPASPSEEDCAKYKKMITFVGKAAEWKRQAALLHAMANLEKDFPELALLCVGTGPEPELEKLKALSAELGLKNTFILGARGQDILAEIYTVADLGIFPSFREPFGLVFVECMACRTPVIGANSGGPKDFVSAPVGELVPEPPETTDLNTVPLGIKTLGATLTEAIGRSLKEGWKASKGDACIKLAHDRFTVAAQVKAMLKDAAALPPPAAAAFKVVFIRHGESDWNVKNIFTGWTDVDLSEAGKQEAVEAGKMLKKEGMKFDIVFTSVLKRAIRTAWTALMEADNMSMPIVNTWRLNERHYGGLQGLNKAETAAKHGDEQVKIWRRSYDVPPPALDMSDPRHPANDPMYKHVPQSALPGAESLALTVDRVLPFWFDAIAPCIMSGKSVMVAAHGNSLRAICKYLENMSEAQVLEFNIPTGVPLVYELDSRLRFVKKYYLMDPDEVAKKVAAVANQGKAK